MADPFEGIELPPAAQTELDNLRRGYGILAKLWDHPEHGIAVKKATKAVMPEVRVPEIDVAEPLIAPLRERQTELGTKLDEAVERITKTAEEVNERFNAITKATEDERALTDMKKKFEETRKKYRLTDEGVATVAEVMKERNIPDPEVAAAWVVDNIDKPAPMPSQTGLTPEFARSVGASDVNLFDIGSDESLKALHQNPTKWMDQQVQNIIAEGLTEAA